MRRKVMSTLAVGALALGAMAQSPPDHAGDGGPGPFGPNNFGLCTAWEANETGRENGNAGSAPPFQALQDTAEENDQTVEEWCAENGQHPGGGNGQGRD